MSKAKEWADRLNGREYLKEMSRDEEKQARVDKVLIAFGYSDDGLELRGVVDNEIVAYDGITVYLKHKDNSWMFVCRENRNYLVWIKAEWSPPGFDVSWRTTSNVPSHSFMINEDGEPFCAGLVIDEADMFAAFNGP